MDAMGYLDSLHLLNNFWHVSRWRFWRFYLFFPGKKWRKWFHFNSYVSDGLNTPSINYLSTRSGFQPLTSMSIFDTKSLAKINERTVVPSITGLCWWAAWMIIFPCKCHEKMSQHDEGWALPTRYPPAKLTWLAGKSTIFNREYIFNWSIFHCHVRLPEGNIFWEVSAQPIDA